MRRQRLFHLLILLVLLASAMPAPTATFAAGVVGSGTPASCTAAALNAAMSGGGVVTFDCGSAPHTIALSTPFTISSNTSLDGGGLITLDGQLLRRHFIVNAGVSLTLSNITLANGKVFNSGQSGASIFNYGTLNLVNTTIQDAVSVSGYGAALYNSAGTVNIFNSRFLNNSTGLGYSAGGAISSSGGSMLIDASLFQGNTSAYGGAISSVSDLTIRNSQFFENEAITAEGGALTLGGSVVITNTQITTNTAYLHGGAINITSAGTVLIEDSRIAWNQTSSPSDGAGYGGAIYSAGPLTVRRSSIEHNSANFGGGIRILGDTTLNVEDTLFEFNQAIYAGGGIFQDNAVMNLVNTTFSGNQAISEGGALLRNAGIASLDYLTFVGNLASYGGAIYTRPAAGATTMQGLVFANNPAENCDFNAPSVTWNGVNLSDDVSCFDASATRLIDLPQLTPLADNGGPTRTYLPQPGSPLIDAGGWTCPDNDQRGFPRPIDAGCDLGAVETNPPLPTCGGVFPVVADAWVDNLSPDSNFGTAPALTIALDASSDRRALLAFDLSALGPDPLYISEAVLELPVQLANNIPSGELIEALSLGAAWDENSVTFNSAPPGLVSFGRGGTYLDDNILRLDLTALVTHWHNQQISEHSLALYSAADGLDVILNSRENGDGPRLVVNCAPVPVTNVGDLSLVDDAQETGWSRLVIASSTPLSMQMINGAIIQATFDLTPPAGLGADALDIANWFLLEYADLLVGSLSPDYAWQLKRRSEDGLTLFFRLTYQGVPVYPSDMGVRVEQNGHITGLSGSYRFLTGLKAVAFLEAQMAETLARTAFDPQATTTGETQLRFFLPELAGGGLLGVPESAPDAPADAQANASLSAVFQPPALLEPAQRLPSISEVVNSRPAWLAWQVSLRGPAGERTVFVDAHSGLVLYQEAQQYEGYDLDLENVAGVPADRLCYFSNNNISADFDQEARMVSDNFFRTYLWFVYNFGRDSYDGDGEQIEANIHHIFPGVPNASYDRVCDLFKFQDGMGDIDIVIHEYMHGVVNAEFDTHDNGISAALNESLADTFAAFADIDLFVPGESPGGDWLIGEDSIEGEVRSMADPPSLTPTDCEGRTIYDPDRMSQYRIVSCDGNGTHINAGIPNKLAFLITTGGSFNGQNVTGLGLVKAKRLYYNVLTNRLGDYADFWSLKDALTAEIKALHNSQPGTYTLNNVCQVLRALEAVELGPGDEDCNGLEDSLQDSDGDDVPDAWPNGVKYDNCPNTRNVSQRDLPDRDRVGDACDDDDDGDNVPDDIDNCLGLRNDDQKDADNDDIGNACDDDYDGDGWYNTEDNCRTDPNPLQGNHDTDRYGDACDLDADNDRICNAGGSIRGGFEGVPSLGCQPGAGNVIWSPLTPADNCPIHYNPGQGDADMDLLGNACDLCPLISSRDNDDPDKDKRANPCDDDDDGDFVLDANPDGSPLDNCRLVKNLDQADLDKDGVGLACDADELERFRRGLEVIDKVRFPPSGVLRMPIPVCPGCVQGGLPFNFKTILNVQLGVDANLRITDNRGMVVGKGLLQGGALQFGFRPQAFAVPPLMTPKLPLGASLQTPAESASSIPADQAIYYLEIYPLPGQDLSGEIDFGLTATGEIVEPSVPLQALFLPLVRR